jgi:hypothetical protein
MEPKLYVGSSEVSGITYPDEGHVTAKLVDGTTMTFNLDQWDAVKSETPYEDGSISMRKWKKTIAQVVELFLEADMQMVDRPFVMERIDETIIQNARAAISKKLGIDNQEHLSLRQIDDILKTE